MRQRLRSPAAQVADVDAVYEPPAPLGSWREHEHLVPTADLLRASSPTRRWIAPPNSEKTAGKVPILTWRSHQATERLRATNRPQQCPAPFTLCEAGSRRESSAAIRLFSRVFATEGTVWEATLRRAVATR